MRARIVLLVVGVVVAVAAIGAVPRRAAAQTPASPNLHLAAAYIANINGRMAWDFTPDLMTNIFLDADRTFNDLVPVIDAGPNEADQVVHPEAWEHHVVVLRLNLGLDERATQLNLHDYLAKFQRVLNEQMNLRNRRVVLWVQRADDLPALMIPMAPEVALVPNGRATLSEEFVERYSAERVRGGEKAAAPVAPDLSGLETCPTTAELFVALGLPEDTQLLAGDSQKILQRWIEFRDDALDMAQRAVGEQWDEYERILSDPNSKPFQKINARRDISSQLRAAHLRVVRYDDLSEHPVFVPLRNELVQKMKILSETPAPSR